MSAANKHYYYYDLLNIFASLAVVILHCNGSVHTYTPGKAWIFSLLIEVIFYWAVPVFFMLTGAKTLNYRERHTTSDFLRRRMTRIFFPFFVWSIALYLLRFGIWGNPNELTVDQFVNHFMSNGIEPTYWFFFAMFGITLSIPVLSLLVNNQPVIKYIIIASFIFNSVLPYLFAILGLSWNQDITISVSSSYVMYVLLGFVLSNKKYSDNKKIMRSLFIATLICFGIRYFYTLNSSSRIGAVDRLFFNYGAFTAVFPSIWVFLQFQKLEISVINFPTHLINLIKKLSSCAFGIYLVHKVILDNILCGIIGFRMSNVWFKIWSPFIVYIVSFCIVFALKKIPGIKNIVP